jgi:chemotaxis signal transduction protein
MTCLNEDTLELLVFNLAGFACAVETSQVESLHEFTAEDTAELLWIDRLLGFDGPDMFDYIKPGIISLKCGEYTGCRIVIDSVEDITSCNLDEISPLPLLVEQFTGKNGIWAVVRHDQDKLIFIVDLYKAVSSYQHKISQNIQKKG